MALKSIFFGMCSLVNPLFNRIYRKRLKVLAFHTVSDADSFERKIIYLKKTHSIIDFKTLDDHIKKKTALPDRPLLITFDDGDHSVYEKALPVLVKHNVPSVLFIITSLINTTEPFWWKAIEANLGYAQGRKIIKGLKNKPNADRLAFVKSLEKKIDQRQLSSAELHILERNNVYIGNHTATHPILTNCNDEEVTEELQLAAGFFRHENLTGFRVFAYPNGNGNMNLQKTLTDNGVEYIFLFDHQINKESLNRQALSRIMVDVAQEHAEFSARVSGLHSLLLHLKRR